MHFLLSFTSQLVSGCVLDPGCTIVPGCRLVPGCALDPGCWLVPGCVLVPGCLFVSDLNNPCINETMNAFSCTLWSGYATFD